MTLIYLYLLHFLLVNLVLAARPGPPEVLGPVTQESPLIRVAHVVKGAEVKVYDAVTGDVIARGFGTGETTSFSTTGLPLSLNHDVTAEQETSEGLSGQSGRGLIQIVKIVKPGPPAIISRTHLCMRAIWVDNLVLGATVVAQIGSTVLASKFADQSPIWLEFDSAVPRAEGDRIEIKQSITYSSGTFAFSFLTEPLQTFRMFMNLRKREAISVMEPLDACMSELHFTYATPGALLTEDTATFSAISFAPDFQHTLDLPQPLSEPTLKITESLWAQCEGTPDAQSEFDVFMAEAVKPPTSSIKPCSDSPKVHFDNLDPYGKLFILHKDASREDIRYWPIGKRTSDDFDLPQDWSLTDAELIFWQTDFCGTPPSKKTTLELDTSDPNTLLEITQPIYECSSLVTYTSGPSSAETTVWSETDGPISKAFKVDVLAHPPNIHTPVLYGPLKVGNIFLQQVGCRTNLKSRSVPVEPLPDLLPKPVIPGTVFAPQQFIHVTNVLKGAMVEVYVDTRTLPATPIKYGAAEAYSSDVFVPLDPIAYPFWPYALQLGDTVTARQFFPTCPREQIASSSRSDDKNVERGFLKATWSGNSVHKIHVPGPIAVLHVQVVDRNSGACIKGDMDFEVVPDRGWVFRHETISPGCTSLCDCDMDFTIPDTETVSSLTITFRDRVDAFEHVSTTITVLSAPAGAAAGEGHEEL